MPFVTRFNYFECLFLAVKSPCTVVTQQITTQKVRPGCCLCSTTRLFLVALDDRTFPPDKRNAHLPFTTIEPRQTYRQNAFQMRDRMVVLMCNLKPMKVRGIDSQAMIMCAIDDDGREEIIDPPQGSVPGDRITFDGFSGEMSHGPLCASYFQP